MPLDDFQTTDLPKSILMLNFITFVGCASIPTVPSGDWYCQYCQNTFEREKLVEHNANASAAGRDSGIDSIEQITKRCFRIVKNIEAELTGCALCRS